MLMHFTYALVHIAQTATLLTLYGKGTRIDLVSYIAFNPRASPSNISGPMRLACEKNFASIPLFCQNKTQIISTCTIPGQQFRRVFFLAHLLVFTKKGPASVS
jgi:hypothetical protein